MIFHQAVVAILDVAEYNANIKTYLIRMSSHFIIALKDELQHVIRYRNHLKHLEPLRRLKDQANLFHMKTKLQAWVLHNQAYCVIRVTEFNLCLYKCIILTCCSLL